MLKTLLIGHKCFNIELLRNIIFAKMCICHNIKKRSLYALNVMNLYRIKYTNYRNDFAFAIALHQMGISQRIPTPMSMLSDNALIIESDEQGVMFKQGDTVNIVNQQDIHIMDKEWCNG